MWRSFDHMYARVYPMSVFSARCNICILRLCYNVSVHLFVHLSVTEVHWRIIVNLCFKFRSNFTAHCDRRAACRRRAACGWIISCHASQCYALLFVVFQASNIVLLIISVKYIDIAKQVAMVLATAPVLASQAEAIVDLGRTWPQHRIDIH